MRIRVLMLTAIAILTTAGPAFAQSQGAGDNAGSRANAEGSSVSGGSSSSSAAVKTSGSSVGVVQGNVAEGSTGSTSSDAGDQSGSANSGGGVGGQSVGAADAPNAASDGVLRKLDLPAIDTARDATPASSSGGSSMYLFAVVGAVVLGLAVLYRRLPRTTSA